MLQGASLLKLGLECMKQQGKIDPTYTKIVNQYFDTVLRLITDFKKWKVNVVIFWIYTIILKFIFCIIDDDLNISKPFWFTLKMKNCF